MFKFQNIKILSGRATRLHVPARPFSMGNFNSNLVQSSSATDTSFLDRSFMKIVGADVDTMSDDYLNNYE